MKRSKQWLALILLVIVLFLLNFIASRLSWQSDLTADKLYTLSPGTIALLGRINEPITLTYYFSRSQGEISITAKNFATRIEDLLKQYQRHSNGKIVLEIVDPKPDSDEEANAVRSGISGQSTPNGEQVYFGIAALQLDREATMPTVLFEREAFLEYDISQLIYQVQQGKLAKVAVLSPLDINNMQKNAPQSGPWVFIQNLQNYFDVVPVFDKIPADADLLFVLHPQTLSPGLQFEIDQFLLSGKSLVVAVDPSSVQQMQSIQSQPMTGMLNFSSDLQPLFDSWGIGYDAKKLIGDYANAANLTMGRNGKTMDYPLWLHLKDFNQTHPVTTRLNQMLLPEVGSFTVRPDMGLTLTPLIESSRESGELNAVNVPYQEPEDILKSLKVDGLKRVIAGIVTGTFKTAFPEGLKNEASTADAPVDSDGTLTDTESQAPQLMQGEGRLVVIADTDFLADRYSVRPLNMYSMMPINDNLAFLTNLFDFLSGSSDLINLRTKGSGRRVFERVENLKKAAQQVYQAKLETVDQELSDLQKKLLGLQQQQSDEKLLVATPELQQAIEKYRAQEAGLRIERREISKKLREHVESLKYKLLLLNLLVVPLCIGMGGILFFQSRNNRKNTARLS
jgi:ABC-type uncharacterized transport system involved in gliding motility auxiliary subunit